MRRLAISAGNMLENRQTFLASRCMQIAIGLFCPMSAKQITRFDFTAMRTLLVRRVAEGRRQMMAHMFALRQNFQIVNHVIARIAVSMMHDLAAVQTASQSLLHNRAMLFHASSVDRNHPIAFRREGARSCRSSNDDHRVTMFVKPIQMLVAISARFVALVAIRYRAVRDDAVSRLPQWYARTLAAIMKHAETVRHMATVAIGNGTDTHEGIVC